MKASFLALITVMLSSCAQVNYTTYVGPQQDWPFATGAVVQQQFALPVYNGPPERPYRVLGWVEVDNTRGAMKFAVKEAANRGADAVILLESETTSFGTAALPREGHARVVAIKFV